MKDPWGRVINYLRISVTDRCNMRCRYCMPMAVPDICHEEILTYEEFLSVCRVAVSLGIDRFKITGGEPLVRKGIVPFIATLKAMPGVNNVTLTTNGIYLKQILPDLEAVGIDGVNISLDTMEAGQFQDITGVDGLYQVKDAIAACAASRIHTKINTVLMEENKDQISALAEIAAYYPVDVRFIEVMPIGVGRNYAGPAEHDMLQCLMRQYPDLHRINEKRGNGPAVYFKSRLLNGRIGFIAANTHRFCIDCNRMRLTSTGQLKPCLCYDTAVELKPLLRAGTDFLDLEEMLVRMFTMAVSIKPKEHCFTEKNKITEYKTMNRIGG
ncbi:GTP 3',8-cyclase MoaA [Megasphaera paucivorans]|uniref:Cyclic pyranopterin phosphate synthase n=1 Tax=Megasphaera paucivorans TaxID=349095 RepID=A0A1G9WG03_9FIRM|nr:GTP 3',8-cyclase MoaA [Megasphaera paucivorans]SDM82955.1 cyclic pyranopterin phosphate synthase [Megasphaera paucivorans]